MDRLPQSQVFHGHYLSCRVFSVYGPDKVHSAYRFQLFFFWHNVRMYHWSTRPMCPGFVGNMWTIMAKSRMTAFTIGLSAIFVLIWDWARTSPDLPSVPSSEIAHLEKGCRPWLVIIIEDSDSYHLDFGKLCTTFKKAHSPPSKFYFSFVFWKDLFVVCFSSGDL